MNDLQIFNNPEFGEVRAIEINEEAWFVGADIARALGYAKPQDAVSRHVDGDDSLIRGVLDSSGKTQKTKVINESGVYALIIMSQLPSAKKFKKWVTKEVLPSIRKTGSYTVNQPPMTQSELILKIAEQGVAVEKRLELLEQKSAEFQNKIENTLQVFARPNPDHWKDDMETAINALIETNNLSHPKFREKLYKELEMISGKDIKARTRNLKGRMKKQGYTYKEQQAITMLEAISKDKQLKALFEGIVTKYQAVYSIQQEQYSVSVIN